MPWIPEPGDPDAIHKSEAGEINSLDSVTPADADVLVIEDASDGFSKKKVTVASLPSGGSGGFPSWQTYTPTWTGSTSNPSIGGGTLTGKYLQVGSTAFVVVEMVAGTGTNFGSGEWFFSLPVEAADLTHVGPALAWDQGTLKHEGIAWLFDTETVQCTSQSNGADWGSGVPFTWNATNGDLLRFSITYETV